MKIGIITDVHNNVLALIEILKKFDAENCEKIICCGDIIGIGPYPEQTVRKIMEIPELLAVKGNHDRYFVESMPTDIPNDEYMELGEMEHHKWEHKLLSKQSYDFLKSLPLRIDIVIENVKITILHYCMNKQNKYVKITKNPTIQDCYNMFYDIDSGVIIYGHDHIRAINKDDKRLFINCGPLGCPSKKYNIARGGILTVSNGNATIEPIEVTYDVEKVINEIDSLNYPDTLLIKRVFYDKI
ncbi:MAG: hypothetical protein A2Y17_04025 [Clostridiales bacterium GWF2_38_85]|nr:MAG: hypothetical protein A2Y17_04025 [Clostridiales bacterium GWF2_38_85]HBL83966.1 metallophosphoesterase [Clostridiales bacterium]